MKKSKINRLQWRELTDCLTKLCFISYKEYLKSELWKTIKKKVINSNNGKCKYCDRKSTQVHHTSYDFDTMSGKNLRYLHPVCSACHKTGYKKQKAVKPTGECVCPRCHKNTLTTEESVLNKLGTKEQKTVCKYCVGSIKLKYKKDNHTFTSPKYFDLPKYYRWHFNKKI